VVVANVEVEDVIVDWKVVVAHLPHLVASVYEEQHEQLHMQSNYNCAVRDTTRIAEH
jgi:hypothetical protein